MAPLPGPQREVQAVPEAPEAPGPGTALGRVPAPRPPVTVSPEGAAVQAERGHRQSQQLQRRSAEPWLFNRTESSPPLALNPFWGDSSADMDDGTGRAEKSRGGERRGEGTTQRGGEKGKEKEEEKKREKKREEWGGVGRAGERRGGGGQAREGGGERGAAGHPTPITRASLHLEALIGHEQTHGRPGPCVERCPEPGVEEPGAEGGRAGDDAEKHRSLRGARAAVAAPANHNSQNV